MFGELVGGVADGLRGAAYLIAHPRLWKWVLAPALVTAVVFTILIGWLLGALSAPLATVAAFLPGNWSENLFKLAAGIILAVASLSIFISFAALIAGPFNEVLSETIEEHITGTPSPKFRLTRFLADAAIGVIHAARRVLIYLTVMLVL